MELLVLTDSINQSVTVPLVTMVTIASMPISLLLVSVITLSVIATVPAVLDVIHSLVSVRAISLVSSVSREPSTKEAVPTTLAITDPHVRKQVTGIHVRVLWVSLVPTAGFH